MSWEERLNRLRVLLDVWIDVQRRWVYLEQIFYGSSDIRQLLPTEYARFKSIDSEFLTLMRKVAYKPRVLDVLALDLQRSLKDSRSCSRTFKERWVSISNVSERISLDSTLWVTRIFSDDR